jgi:hypothetical protein
VWLDGASLAAVAAGVAPAAGPMTAALPWTPGLVPGVRAMWQALTIDLAFGLQLGNPSFVILP